MYSEKENQRLTNQTQEVVTFQTLRLLFCPTNACTVWDNWSQEITNYQNLRKRGYRSEKEI